MKSRPRKKAPARKKTEPPAQAGRSDRAAAKEDKKHAKVLENVLHEVTAEPDSRHLEEWVQVPCPYCGEEFEVHVTSEEDGQTLYEDCEVCCRPISLHVHTEEGELQVEAHRS